MRKSHRLNQVYPLGHLSLYLLCTLPLTPTLIAAHAKASSPTMFLGTSALADTKHAVSFGERPSGSEAIIQLREWISTELKRDGGEVSLDNFTGLTPGGSVPMANVILKLAGTSGKAIAVTGHYDTKKIPMVHFLGANDGGSSAGFLIEFARAASKIKHSDDIYIVFFDGEEAVGTWSNRDSLYGSRHLASKWAGDGTLSRVKALINIDMIGDKDLDVLNDGNSSQALRDQVAQIAAKLGDSKYFPHQVSGIDDDHMPFIDAGVNAIDIIDATYGPGRNGSLGAYWHDAADTMDKLSAHSLQVVGDVILELVRELEQTHS